MSKYFTLITNIKNYVNFIIINSMLVNNTKNRVIDDLR